MLDLVEGGSDWTEVVALAQVRVVCVRASHRGFGEVGQREGGAGYKRLDLVEGGSDWADVVAPAQVTRGTSQRGERGKSGVGDLREEEGESRWVGGWGSKLGVGGSTVDGGSDWVDVVALA
jgi:hypothetical protein